MRWVLVVALALAICVAGVSVQGTQRRHNEVALRSDLEWSLKELWSSVTNKVKLTISTAVSNLISKISCPATNGLGHTKVKKCLASAGLVSDPMFWAHVSRAAEMSRRVYGPLNKLPKKGEFRWISTFDAKFSAQAGVAIVEGPIHKISALKSTCPEKNRACLQTAVNEHNSLWGKYWESIINTKTTSNAPARVEVVVRGTQEKTDIIADLVAFKVDAPATTPGKVHLGFRTQANALLPGILKTLLPFKASIQRGSTELSFYGHSLGGAVAQILADTIAEQWNLKKAKTIVITFGSPRVGNQEWATMAEKRVTHYRFKFMVDIVAEVPTNGMGFVHSDELHLGLVVLPRTDPRRYSQARGAVQVVCPGECSRARAEGKVAGLSHASDTAYSMSSSVVWNTMMDLAVGNPGVFFPASAADNEHTLASVETYASSGAESMLSTLHCFGQITCELFRAYPGVKIDQMYTCLQKLAGSLPVAGRVRPEMTVPGTSYPASLKLHLIANLYNSFTSNSPIGKEAELAKCLAPHIKPGFYDKVSAEDWVAMRGDVEAVLTKAGGPAAATASPVDAQPRGGRFASARSSGRKPGGPTPGKKINCAADADCRKHPLAKFHAYVCNKDKLCELKAKAAAMRRIGKSKCSVLYGRQNRGNEFFICLAKEKAGLGGQSASQSSRAPRRPGRVQSHVNNILDGRVN